MLGRFPRALAALLLVSAPLRAQMNTEGVAAIVNGDIITFSDVRRIADDAEKAVVAAGGSRDEIIERIKKVRTDALNAMVDRQLIISEFKTAGYQFPEKMVDDQIHSVIVNNFNGDRTAFIGALQQSGRTMDQYRKEQRDAMIVQFMRSRYVSSQVVISPARVEEYFQKNSAKFVSSGEAKVGMILIKRGLVSEPRMQLDGTVRRIDPARSLADEVIAKLDRGEKFADLARKYSEGPKREEGGDLGWLRKDQMRKELADVVFSLSPGQHSKIIEAPEGYYIIQAYEFKRAGSRELAEVRADVEKMVRIEESQKREKEWIERLRKKGYVKVF